MTTTETTTLETQPAPGARMNFQGIVEADNTNAEPAHAGDDSLHAVPIGDAPRNWNAESRKVMQASRMFAIMIFFALALGWPVGAYVSQLTRFGTSEGWVDLLAGMITPGIMMFTIFVPVLIWLCGYLLSNAFKMINAAESIAGAAREFIHPGQSAVYNAESVGLAVRGQIAAVNSGVDDALHRLASVEAMIRTHVEAIESAGHKIETQAHGAVDKVAEERSRLISLTENLNDQADAFASAIAERAQAGIEAIGSADQASSEAEMMLEDRLSRLESAAARALQSFEALSQALHGADENIQKSANAIAATSETAAKASKSAAESILSETKSLSENAANAAAGEAEKVAEATNAALRALEEKTASAIARADSDTQKAQQTIEAVTKSALATTDAAARASSDISAASAQLEQTTKDALDRTEKASNSIEERSKALAEARAALEKENARLEALIEEQRSRADRLADAIATQTERLSKLAEAQLKEQAAAEKAVQKPIGETTQSTAPPATKKPAKQPPSKKTGSPSKPAQNNSSVLHLGPSIRRHSTEPPAKPPSTDKLEKLAQDIEASRSASPKEANSAPKSKQGVSWKEILDATDEAEPLDLAAASKSAPKTSEAPEPSSADANLNRNAQSTQHNDEAAMAIIRDLQAFTFDLETRLYGEPPSALRERFARGDRNVFANRILRLNEADVKRRIRMESGRDREFEGNIHKFLQGFERLLEDATTSETADEDLEEYLSSPLGRVYLLIGATVGYFA